MTTKRPIKREMPPIGKMEKFSGAWVSLERPGEPRDFEVKRAMIDEVQAKHDLKAFINGLKGKSAKEVTAASAAFGEKVMKTVIELADGKYTDDLRVMIEKVATQTGIPFPHRFQRYMELMLYCFGPEDRWRLRESTIRRIKVQGFHGRFDNALVEAGLDRREPFKAFWTSALKVAAKHTGDKLEIEIPRTLADGKGFNREFEFSITLVKG